MSKICVVCKKEIPNNHSYYEDATGKKVHATGDCYAKVKK